MSKGKKRCHFCKCELTNQNRTKTGMRDGYSIKIWVDCCHACKHKEERKS